jgi:hypothetical protein
MKLAGQLNQLGSLYGRAIRDFKVVPKALGCSQSITFSDVQLDRESRPLQLIEDGVREAVSDSADRREDSNHDMMGFLPGQETLVVTHGRPYRSHPRGS